MSENPLLELTVPDSEPDWPAIRPEHAEPAIRAILQRQREEFEALLSSGPQSPGWEDLLEPLECMDDDLSRVFAPIGHLFSVCNSPAWQQAYEACQQAVTEWSLDQSQDPRLYRAVRAVASRPDLPQWPSARRRIVENTLRALRHGGAELAGEQRERFRTISLRLSELGTRFEQNLLASTDAFSLNLTQAERLAGLPQDLLERAAQRARAEGASGWTFGLDYPTYDAVMSHARDRALREQFYRAWVTRASSGAHDNAPLIDEILALRREQAALLGASNYAELALEDRMARSPQQIEDFLLDLARRARPRAEAELARLRELAAADGIDALAAWDTGYYAERLRERELAIDEERLRGYLPLPQVLDGLFALSAELMGLRFVPREREAWHPDVRCFDLHDADDRFIGRLYLDPYARSGKRGGAWMDGLRDRHVTRERRQHPVAVLVCNFAPPSGDAPSLLTHDELCTLFHEFGHGLHHLLTEVDELGASGIHGVPWDAVELPSQFFENFCYEPVVLRRFARHWRSGQAIPDELVTRLRRTRRFLSGIGTLRQVELALFDLRLHVASGPVDVRRTLAAVRDEVSVFPPPDFNRFENSFSHIFAGGYAAGYYSYKWAEVLAADAWSAFEEAGVLDRETAMRFRRCILARGGAEPPDALFAAFRGREARIDALLRQQGLIEDAEQAA